MRLVRGFPRHPGRGRVVTLGVFDGVHRGHARILAALRKNAVRLGVPAAVITFDDHPHGTLAPERRPPRLATDAQRLARMQALGVDEVFLVHFTRRLADTPAEVFVRRVLVRRLCVRHMVVGEDFMFGRGTEGDIPLLRRLGMELGFGVTVVPAWRDRGRTVSSTLLRRRVAAGDIAGARRWLGWDYALHGKVIHGEGRGGTIGLPTANLKTIHEIVPAPGVYAVLLHLRGREWPALCHIGRKPTFHTYGPATIEIHIPGWKGPLYGRRLEARFLQQLRGVRKFSGPEALRRQVRRDWEKAEKAFQVSGFKFQVKDLSIQDQPET
jgi:riboflavin kinase / FMN adenylyltransferase